MKAMSLWSLDLMRTGSILCIIGLSTMVEERIPQGGRSEMAIGAAASLVVAEAWSAAAMSTVSVIHWPSLKTLVWKAMTTKAQAMWLLAPG